MQTPRNQQGLIIVNTGSGKGKTTAALGVIMRAVGWNMKIVMLQFIKSPERKYGEHETAKRLGVEIIAGGGGFVMDASSDSDRALALGLWQKAKDVMLKGHYDIVILDELSYPLKFGWIEAREVIDLLKQRPLRTSVIITGRDIPREIVEISDIATEMTEIKHAFHKGIKAQPGIDY